ncbi:hypothetical protein [Sphingomonas sp.]|uniref:hypothetical protein n=1 Tax=Sphingomonas sp. TaxID=28214 RepID=UPI003B002F4C
MRRPERLEREAALMRERWGDMLTRDRYWSPNLDQPRDDFAFALSPRVVPPWRVHPPTARGGDAHDQDSGAPAT